MIKRVAALLLLLAVMATGMVCAWAETDAQETAEDEQTAQTLDVAVLLEACRDHQLSTHTQLVDALHEYVLGEMEVSIAELELQNANSALEDLQADYLMGLVESADLEAAQKAVDSAQSNVNKAELEQMKRVSQVRGLTDVDITSQSADAQDFFLTLQPGQLSLSFLQDALIAYGNAEDTQMALTQLEQDYIDITLYYDAIVAAQEEYLAAEEARQSMARDVVMGNATAQDFRTATVDMRKARLALMTAISDYSRLLYRINESCGGALSDAAGLLPDYLGTQS